MPLPAAGDVQIGQRRDVEQAARIVAQGDRRLINHQLVHQIRLQQGAAHAHAGFHQQFIHAVFLRQLGQQHRQIHLAGVIGQRQLPHRHALGLQLGALAGVGQGAGHHGAPAILIHRALQRASAHHPFGHHAQRLALNGKIAHRQPRVVGHHRAGAGQHRAAARAQALHIGACCRAGDPLAAAVAERAFAVQAGPQLDRHPRPLLRHALDEALVQLGGLGGQQAMFGNHARRRQPRQTAPSHQRIGVGHRRHHAADASGNQRVGARRGAAVVAAWLQRHIGGGAGGLGAGFGQRVHFGVRLTGAVVPAAAHQLAIAHQHAAHARIGRGGEEALGGQAQGLRHPGVVFGAEGGGHDCGGLCWWEISRMASENSETS